MPLFDFADLNTENGENQFEPYEILTHPDGSVIELGRGSMGITYHAVDTTLQFPVALKVIDFKADVRLFESPKGRNGHLSVFHNRTYRHFES